MKIKHEGCGQVILIIIVLGLLFVILPFIIGLIWTWVVTDVFAGAVEQHILPATLTYTQAVKLQVLLLVLGITGKGRK